MELRNKIIEKASRLFFKFGIRSVTMDDLSKELGISKKTLYQHFADKDNLITEMIKADLCCDISIWEEIDKKKLNALEKLVETVNIISKMFTDVNPSVLNDLKKYHSNAMKIIEDHKVNFVIPTVMKDLQQGIKEGLFRPEINTRQLAQYRYGQVILGFDQTVFPKEEYDLKETQIFLLDLFIRSILTEKGHESYYKLQVSINK
jgi:TetR/AcrR family transcriptional regulator, cholesterol catabolism regulator